MFTNWFNKNKQIKRPRKFLVRGYNLSTGRVIMDEVVADDAKAAQTTLKNRYPGQVIMGIAIVWTKEG